MPKPFQRPRQKDASLSAYPSLSPARKRVGSGTPWGYRNRIPTPEDIARCRADWLQGHQPTVLTPSVTPERHDFIAVHDGGWAVPAGFQEYSGGQNKTHPSSE